MHTRITLTPEAAWLLERMCEREHLRRSAFIVRAIHKEVSKLKKDERPVYSGEYEDRRGQQL